MMFKETRNLAVGYVQKEAGSIPNSWEMKTLHEISELNMGQSPDSKNYNNIGNGIPLIQGNADIKKRKSIQRVWTTQVTKTCRAGDIIMTVRAPVGLIGLASEKSCIGRGVCYFRIKNIDKYFLFYSLVYREKDWKILEQGSTFTAANSNQIRGFQIAVPINLSEQTAIANVLSDTDTLIEQLEKLIDKKKTIKQGAMQELLTGKRRLPGFRGKWKINKIKEVGNLLMGQSPIGSSYSSNVKDMPLINGATELKQEGIFITKYTSKPTRLCKKGDLLFCIRATIGNLQFADRVYCLGRGVAVLSVFDDFDTYLISYKLIDLFEMMKRVSEGGVIKGLKKDELANFEIVLPIDKDEQTAIAKILSDMDSEIDKLEQKLAKYKMIKQGMMQVLLTGKIRLV